MFFKKIKDFIRKPLRKMYLSKLNYRNITIISSNCLGGVMYHDAMLQFNSPTINLTIYNFLDFCENLPIYLSKPIVFSHYDSFSRPVCCLEKNIKIIMNHYSTAEEAIECWIKRTGRVNNYIFIVTTDEFIKTNEDIERFDALKYPKVCFVSKPLKYEWAIFLPEFINQPHVGDSTRVVTISGKRIFEKHFDYIQWINENFEKYYKC